jgi:hypothetical protein
MSEKAHGRTVLMDGAPKVTSAMIEAGARCLRAYMEEEAPSHSESLYLAEKVLQAALLRGSPFPDAPGKAVKP